MTETQSNLLDRARGFLTAPRSLGWQMALVMAGVVLALTLAISLAAVGLLRQQAEDQALAQVRLAGLSAREEIRRIEEDTLTYARVLGARPTLERLANEGQGRSLQLLLQRFCDTSSLDACALLAQGAVVAQSGKDLPWTELVEASSEQGEHFMVVLPSVPGGLVGATSAVTGSGQRQIVVVRLLDQRMAEAIGDRVGMEVRLLPLSNWLDTIDAPFRELHSKALSRGKYAADRIEPLDLFAASVPVQAATGEGIALIETRLPAAGVDSSVRGFIRRLVIMALLLGTVAVVAAVWLGRRIVEPLTALTGAVSRLAKGDFSTSIPAVGNPEVAALAATMETMRRNLLELTVALRRRETEAQALLNGIVEGVYAVDAQRNVRYLNPQAAQLLGINAEDAKARFCGDVLRPCGTDGTRPCDTSCPILQARVDGRGQATERLERADGSQRTVVITSAPLSDGLQVQVMRDETELEAVRRARDTVLANISHEFRTPLAAQLASIELLRDGLQEMSREQIDELLQSLQRGSLRLTRLIDNLLESVRIESGQLAIRRQPVELLEVIEEAEGLVEGLFAQRGQRLEKSFPESLPIVSGDAPRLAQVFVNLLANANKFAPDGSLVRIGGEAAENEVTLWVEDEGPGVPDMDRGSIFERFYRASDQEPEPRGLGLGLWIVKSIVERHGGRVDAVRTAAGRTRFTVTLPVAGGPA